MTSPSFDLITIDLDRNYYPAEQFIIETINHSDKNIYIQEVKLNGEVVKDFHISFKDIVKGGKLEYVMGPEPSKRFKNWCLRCNSPNPNCC